MCLDDPCERLKRKQTEKTEKKKEGNKGKKRVERRKRKQDNEEKGGTGKKRVRLKRKQTCRAGGPRQCAYGRRSPSDAFERVRRVEVLGLANVSDGHLCACV